MEIKTNHNAISDELITQANNYLGPYVIADRRPLVIILVVGVATYMHFRCSSVW
jgi:hypothetical protein